MDQSASKEELSVREKEIKLELDKLYAMTKDVPADSQEGIQLSIKAFKLINELLDLNE